MFLAQCENPQSGTLTSETKVNHSFIVMGHAYGSPVIKDPLGMYESMISEFSFIRDSTNVSLAVLTGDVVNHSTIEEWNAVKSQMNQLGVDYHIAPGNHDRGPLFLELFEKYYYSFLLGSDLFIILSPTNWNNIQDDQKDFLEETLNNFTSEVDNIFIFCHELIWWSPDGLFQNVNVNNVQLYHNSTNYWTEIDPIFRSFENPIYLFAGDIGATNSSSHYMYYHYDNVRLIASGMGKGGDDNYLIVEVIDGEVKLNLLAIEGDRYRLGNIELYELP